MNSQSWGFFSVPCLFLVGWSYTEGNAQKLAFFALLAMAFRIMSQVTFYGDKILSLLEKEKENE